MALVTGLALTLPACGGDDDGGSEESQAPASLAEIQSCVEEAGFATEQNTLTANPAIGLVGDILVTRPVGTPGLGVVAVLEFTTDAEAADYAGSEDESSGKFVISPADAVLKKQRDDTAAITESVQACVL